MFGKMPEDISPIIGLDARNTIPLELFHENNALRLCRHLGRRWISRKKIALYFFAKLGKQPAFSNPSKASDSSIFFNRARSLLNQQRILKKPIIHIEE